MMATAPSLYEPVIKRFSVLLKNERLGHAYLFVGPASIGKTQTALAIAKLVNCELNQKDARESFCDGCPSCIKINSGNHPDVHLITKEKEESIKIEQVRGMNYQIQMKAFEARKKIFIIKEADSLTPEASNALLKTLEEPSAGTLLFLTTSFPQRVFSTINSRCQLVHFFPLTNERLKAQLIGDSMDGRTAHFLASFAEGSLGKARGFKKQELFERKNEIINQFVYSRDQAYVELLAKDRRKISEALGILLSWFRDLMLIKQNVEANRLIHLDRINDLKTLQTKYTFGELKEIVAEITKTSRLLEDNFNIKLALILIKEKLWRK